MERSTKMVLVLAFLLSALVVCLEGRDIKSKPKNYQPQNYFGGFGGVFGSPGAGWVGGSGLPLVPGFGLGRPGFDSIPVIGGVPFAPIGGLGGAAGGGQGVVGRP